MSNWKETTLGEVAEKIAMGPFGSNIKIETFVNKGIPVVSGMHLKGLKLEDGNYNFITEEHAEKLKNSLVYRGDVIFTHAGNIGQVAYIPNNSKFKKYIISQRQFYLRCNKERLLPEYITYFFKTRLGQHKLLANSSQVGVPSIAQPSSYLKLISLNLPSIKEQKEIADMLLSLDDKTELLREENKGLEELAKTIFKEWFVNFNFPDKNGKPYKSSGGKMIESALGEIPENWRVEKLKEVIKLQGGFVHDTSATGNTKSLIAKMGVVDGKSWFNRNSVLKYSQRVDTKYKLLEDDLLVSTRDVTRDKVVIGNVAIIPKDLSDEGIFAGSNTWIIKSNLNKYFLFLLFRGKKFRDHINESAKGTTIVMITKDSFLNYELVLPDQSTMEKFDLNSGSLFVTIKNNTSQIKTLSDTRDALLPKLMSGKMSILRNSPID